MGNKKRNKTEKRKNSSEGDNNGHTLKAGRYRSNSGSNSSQLLLSEYIEDSVFDPTLYHTKCPITENKPLNSENCRPKSKMETNNDDILSYLKKLDTKITNVDSKLQCLENLERKVDNFDQELKKIWVKLHDMSTTMNERITIVEDKTESIDFVLSQTTSKLSSLEKQKDDLHNEVTYLQAQSMRNNLVFTNIPEAPEEKNEDTEVKLRSFLVDKMKIAQDQVDKLSFERVHRMGHNRNGGYRNIVAKFTLYKEKEFVRKQWKTLMGTPFFVNEQLPKEVVDKRKRLLPRMKAAREQGKTSWISYDTLYIDGKPIRD